MTAAAKCGWETCAAAATHTPRILIPAAGYPQDRNRSVSMYLGLECCLQHAQDFDVAAFIRLNPKLQDVWRIAMRGKVLPDLARAWVEAAPLDHPDYLVYKRQTKRP